jgi:hypothetical protein
MTYTFFFVIKCFVKNTGPTILLALTAHQTSTLTGRSRTSWIGCGFRELRSDYFAYLYIPSSGTTFHQRACQLGIDLTSTIDYKNQLKNEPC